MKNSFEDGNAMNENKYLGMDKNLSVNSGVFLRPTLQINNISFRGILEPRDIFVAVCSAFKDPPKECSEMMYDRPMSLSEYTLIFKSGRHFRD